MLKGRVYRLDEITQSDINSMYELMAMYYDNLKKENFISDLEKKSRLIILKDNDNQIKGFTTIVLYDATIENIKIKLLFSGDTIIHKDYWSNNDLAQVWIKNALELKKGFDEKLYWLLISKGYKTYKYLSAFYKEFYPKYDKQTPNFEQKIIDFFGEKFYSKYYDKKTGIIKMNKTKDYLKEEYSKIPKEKLTDKNIEFFVHKNPLYYKGNELVCVAELDENNLNKAGKRVLGI